MYFKIGEEKQQQEDKTDAFIVTRLNKTLPIMSCTWGALTDAHLIHTWSIKKKRISSSVLCKDILQSKPQWNIAGYTDTLRHPCVTLFLEFPEMESDWEEKIPLENGLPTPVPKQRVQREEGQDHPLASIPASNISFGIRNNLCLGLRWPWKGHPPLRCWPSRKVGNFGLGSTWIWVWSLRILWFGEEYDLRRF